MIVNQFKGDYTTHQSMIGLYLAKAKALLESFDMYKIQQIPKAKTVMPLP